MVVRQVHCIVRLIVETMGQSESLPVKLNVEEKDGLYIKGYRPDLLKCIGTVLAMVLSFGILFVVLVWRKDIKMKMMYSECNLRMATKILVKVLTTAV